MPETATPTTKPELVGPAPNAPATPEVAAPDLAPEAAVQAVVESFRQAGVAGVAGGSASGGAAGGSAQPGAPRWTPRPAVGARDLVALQRMAGNRAVSTLVGRRSGAPLQPQATSRSVQREGNAPPPKPADGGAAGGKAAEARAMVVRSASSAQAAKDLAKWASGLTDNKTGGPLKLVIITLEQKAMDVWDRNGAHLKGPFELALPKGTTFDQGVFVTMPGGGASMRIRLDPTTMRFRPYEDAAILQELDAGKAKAGPGEAAGGAGAKDPAASAPAAPAGSGVEPAKAPRPFDLRKYVKNPAGLDELAGQYGDAAEFLVVRTPPESEGGGKGKGGGKRSSGFGGELEGHGTPPNRPAWPVTMEGPKTLPIGGQGTFAATINWAAEGANTINMITAQMGNEIHYRWELFDISAQAKKQADKEAARAKQAKDAIAALMGTQAGGGAGTPGTNGKPAAKGAAAVAPPKPKAVGSPDDKSLADEILERQRSAAGTGADQNGITAGADFERDYANLWGDTKRTWSAVGKSKKESWLERRSDDVANVTAVALLPISGVITTLGATFRYANEKFSGDRQQQDIPLKQPGTYLVRVIATPRVQVGPNGEQLIRPPSVAVQTVEVVEMEKMVQSALMDPGTKLKEANNALDAAKKSGDKAAIDAAQAQFDSVSLEVEGDPLVLLDKKIAAKEKELVATKAKWEKYNIRGPIIDVENQIETLKKRKELYELQERRRVSQLKDEGKPITPPFRVNATLASELTGQPYPLLISVGDMGMAGTKYRWKVLDATSRKAEGFEGIGDTKSEAIEAAFEEFAKDAQYGRGIIGVQLPKALMEQLEPGSKADRRYASAPAGWAVARGRIDDLVMTLAAIGLFVASAGTAAAILGGVVAAAKLIHRLHSGTLELDVEAISDVLAIFGAVAATAQGFAKAGEAAAKGAQAAAADAKAVHVAGLKAAPVGNLFVLAPETAAVESNLARASAALARAGALAQKVEWANEALGYAGLVWGNATFLMSMADIAAQEASGAISHAEARRQRANAIGGAIQNNGMFIAGNAIKAKQAAKAAKAQAAASAAKTQPSATTAGTAEHPTSTTSTAEPKAGPGGGEAGGPGGAPKEAPSAGTEAPTSTEPTGPKESTGPKEPAPNEQPAAHEQPTKGGTADEVTGAKKPPEPNVAEGQPGGKPGEPRAGAQEGPAGAKPAEPKGPQPGSRKAKAAARKLLEGVITGETKTAGVEDAIKLAGSWKEALKTALGKLSGEPRQKAQEALVAQRDAMVTETWEQVKKGANGKYDALRLENTGTKSFSSDIDATVRPEKGTEAGGTGQQMADQVKLAAEAAQALSEALRKRIGGGETDVVIDTNIYSFIGEGRVKPTDAKARGAQQHVDMVVGLAEQLRGQSEAQFKAFEARLKNLAGDPHVAAEAKALLGEARQFHDARVAEWGKALADAKAANPKGGEAAQKRAARESLLGAKKQELAGLMAGEPPNYEKIAAKQSEINWFAPDAYATPSAFKQAVAHGQRLKGSAKGAQEYKGAEVAAKLREAAGKLKADDPRAAKLNADAKRVESQQRLLDMTVAEHKRAQSELPMDTARVEDLARRAEQLREAIAAPMEKILIGEIWGETGPGDRPGPERLSESAAASGANMGMLEDHVRHAADIDAKVKAAAKYAARIALAEWLSGLRPSGEAIARLLDEFVKSRWDLNADIAPEMLRDMFLRYAEMTGRTKGIVHDKTGVAVGVTDAVKQAFVDDATSWAKATNDGIQAAAIGAKSIENPSVAKAVSPAGDATAAGADAAAAGAPAQSGKSTVDTAPATVPDEKPTMPAPAPTEEAGGPATRRDGAGQQQPAQTGTGPAKGAGGEPVTKVEDIPGGIVVKKDDYAVTVSAKGDPNALVRIEPDGNLLRLTDIYRRNMPPGTGTLLLAEALKESRATRGNEILIHNIQNPETLATYEAKLSASESKLGKTVARALESAGFSVGRMRWEHVHGKLCITVEIQ